jgi:orotidine-5'-phosphate decarboxylase
MKIKLPFNEAVNNLITKKSTYLCIGLDPDMERIPAHLKYEKNPIDLFIREIVEATQDLVVAYKANLAFYECEELNGWEALKNLCFMRPDDVLLILDGKRGDIANTSQKYASTYFDLLGADAVTLNPYMGFDSIEPFLQKPERGAFILTLTSNEGAADFQHLQIGTSSLHQYVARRVETWNVHNNCGLVVGATDIEGLKILRRQIPQLPFLVPGVGAQGADMKEAIKYGRNKNGTGLLINVGRQIIYAGQEKDFARKVREEDGRSDPDQLGFHLKPRGKNGRYPGNVQAKRRFAKRSFSPDFRSA